MNPIPAYLSRPRSTLPRDVIRAIRERQAELTRELAHLDAVLDGTAELEPAPRECGTCVYEEVAENSSPCFYCFGAGGLLRWTPKP